MAEKIYRNLQKLGGSFVISLPKNWIIKNNLDKPVSFDKKTNRNTYSTVPIEIQSNGTLLILPSLIKKEEVLGEEVVLEANKNVIWELLKKSFAGETKIIIISEREINKALRRIIKNYVSRLPNTEIIEETSQKMIIQNFGYKKIPTNKLIQRLLYIVANMIEDLENKSFKDLDDDFEELRKFYFILVIHIRTFLRTGVYISSNSEFTPLKAMDYRMFSEKIIEIAEMLKDLGLIENVINLYKEVKQYFNEVMDAFLQEDGKLAFRVWIKKDILFNKANKLIGNLDYEEKETVKKLMKIAQKIKDMAAFI
ncbi:MAG: hypothetical protein ACXADU_13100 [Promethearchaeota archaeon]|jgi:phosphate uptake regulator